MSETRHDLKIWPKHFEAVVSGRKTFEVRADDREYAEGDTLLLREWNPDTKAFTGRSTERRVSHLLRESAFVRDGFVILSLAAPLAAERGDDDFAQADEYARMLLDDGWAITPDRPTIVLARAYLALRARPVAEYWCVLYGDNEDTGDLFSVESEAHAHAKQLDEKHPDTAHVVVRLVAPSLEGVRARPALPAEVNAVDVSNLIERVEAREKAGRVVPRSDIALLAGTCRTLLAHLPREAR